MLGQIIAANVARAQPFDNQVDGLTEFRDGRYVPVVVPFYE